MGISEPSTVFIRQRFWPQGLTRSLLRGGRPPADDGRCPSQLKVPESEGGCPPARWAPSSYKWSYNPYKWPYKWLTVLIALVIGVINPVITRSGPSCGNEHILSKVTFESMIFLFPFGGICDRSLEGIVFLQQRIVKQLSYAKVPLRCQAKNPHSEMSIWWNCMLNKATFFSWIHLNWFWGVNWDWMNLKSQIFCTIKRTQGSKTMGSFKVGPKTSI